MGILPRFAGSSDRTMIDDFQDWLDAKYALDSRSLNRDVLENLNQRLAAKQSLRCLDLGTGSGAMIKRLVEMEQAASLEITGLDREEALVLAGLERLTRYLRENGFQVESHGLEILGRKYNRTIQIRFKSASALDWKPPSPGYFDLVCAHAFMDLVPLQPAIAKIREFLAPQGIFYTTLNYDGETALIPSYADEETERRILDVYDRSMDSRRINGLPAGGSHAGRKLVGALAAAGFSIDCYGSSDWNITPVNGVYRDRDACCLSALLAMIEGEASGIDAFAPPVLAAWHRDRIRALRAGSLGMIVHQLDILAIKPAVHPS
ncbi:MAG: class I SAM-dependent methyltransferase [Gammaproteobacteria bacterium]